MCFKNFNKKILNVNSVVKELENVNVEFVLILKKKCKCVKKYSVNGFVKCKRMRKRKGVYQKRCCRLTKACIGKKCRLLKTRKCVWSGFEEISQVKFKCHFKKIKGNHHKHGKRNNHHHYHKRNNKVSGSSSKGSNLSFLKKNMQ